MKKKKAGHSHTGKLERGHIHMGRPGGKDEHASAEHHAANKAHGMAGGCCSPPEEYEEGEPTETGAPSMNENC